MDMSMDNGRSNQELEFREVFVDVLFRVECYVHGVQDTKS